MKRLYLWLSVASMAACLVIPALRFTGALPEDTFKTYWAISSLGWFVFSLLRQKA